MSPKPPARTSCRNPQKRLLGKVACFKMAPDAVYVNALEGEGWIGASELATLLGIEFSRTYRVFKRHGSECVLLLYNGKRYYRFTPEGWEAMLADNVARALKR